jgi:hypothetical protein
MKVAPPAHTGEYGALAQLHPAGRCGGGVRHWLIHGWTKRMSTNQHDVGWLTALVVALAGVGTVAPEPDDDLLAGSHARVSICLRVPAADGALLLGARAEARG